MIVYLLLFLFIFNNDMDELNRLYKNKEYGAFIEKSTLYLKDKSVVIDNLFLMKIAFASKQLEDYNRAKVIYKRVLENDTLINDYIEYELLILNLLEKDTVTFLNAVIPFTEKYQSFAQNEKILNKAINISQNNNDSLLFSRFSSKLISINEDYKPELQYQKIQLIQDQNEFLNQSLNYISEFNENKNSSILIDSLQNKMDLSILPDYQKFNLFKSSILTKNEVSESIFANYNDFKDYDKFNLYLSRYHINFKNYDEFVTIINNVEDSITKFPRDIARELPRVYMRQGQTSLAYKYYLNYARSYPDDAFSLNAVTFVLNKYISNDPKKYVTILTEFANSESKYSSYYKFLYVIYLYENKFFKTALFKIDNYIKDETSKWHRDRLYFWKSKLLFEQNSDDEAYNVLSILSQTPFDNYYCIKAYVALLMNNKIENTILDLDIRNNNRSSATLSNDKRFLRLTFLVDVFGKDYIKEEIEKVRSSFKSKEELTEIISFFEENNFFYHAYIYNHKLNRSYFQGKTYKEKKEILNRLFPTYYQGMIDSIADPLKLQDPLVNAIIYRESAFQHDAVSKADAHGLMQLIPATASLMSRKYKVPYRNVYDLYQPQTNIALGTQFLRELLKRFNNNFEVALAAYNAGSTRAKRWTKNFDESNTDLFIEKIPFEQTRTYVKKVMYAYYVYKLIDFYDSNFYYSGIRKR